MDTEAGIDWRKVKEWDEKYYLHITKSGDEYSHTPIERTEGNYIYTADGKKFLDFSSQLVCVNMQQCHPKIKESIKNALDRYGYVWEVFCTDHRSKAAKLIIEDLLGPDGWAGKIRFCNSGSEAVEMALIIARLFTNRPNIITRDHAYHGWTMGAAACTRLRPVRNAITSHEGPEIRDVPGFNPIGFYTAPAPFCYRCPIGHSYPGCKNDDGILACVSATENLIKGIGPETVAAMITEVVQGCGMIHPPDEYIPQIREMTKRLNILWIDDEVICGFGRLGKWFGYQRYKDKGALPDIMTIAKATTNSAIPTGGVIVSKEIAAFLEEYRWWSLNTFAAHPIAMAATVANIEVMMEIDLPGLARNAGEFLGKSLLELQDKHPCIGLVSGKEGLLWGIEMVKNRKRKEPFVKEDRYFSLSGDMKAFPNTIIKNKCAERGVLVGGVLSNTLRIAPILTITEQEMIQAIDALDYAFSEVDKLCED
jgi:taurine--2-oxoglutarate transaminase